MLSMMLTKEPEYNKGWVSGKKFAVPEKLTQIEWTYYSKLIFIYLKTAQQRLSLVVTRRV